MNPSHSTFQTLYPDVDPATPIPLSTAERIALVTATAVLAFGGAYGDLIITGAGLALLLLALTAASRKTARQIRKEARDRFPDLAWAENTITDSLKLQWTLPLTWLAILVICLSTLWLAPGDYATTGATAAALIAATLTWFAPGLSPRWHAQSALAKPLPTLGAETTPDTAGAHSVVRPDH